jgi:predicted acyltransferase
MGETPLRRQRLLSVDVFRGMTILAMILVNNPGDWGTVYWPLLHAAWHGCTPTDLIFPFFLFIVGVAVVLALGPQSAVGTDRRTLVAKIVRRALILFGLGLFLSGFPFGVFGPKTLAEVLDTWRIPGVLQRIAICYLAASLLFIFCRRRVLVGWTVACLLGYWALMVLVPVPGQGAPDLDSKGGHLAGWLDRTLLGSHLWVGGRVYDPEGLLSTLPALATTLLGVWAGLMLVEHRDPLERTVRLLVNGWLLVLVGYVWSWFLPLNKALWTSSYAVMTGGLAMSFLALCHWWFDLGQHPRSARPFVLYGVNAITVFVGSGILGRVLANVSVGDATLQAWIYKHFFLTWLPPYVASLAYALAWVGAWFVALVWMYRRGYVLKV